MCRRLIELLLSLMIVSVPALAQDSTPDERVSQYLDRIGADELLGAQLRERLAGAAGDERTHIAERLGELYTRQLGTATSDEERAIIEARSRALLETIPESDLTELRLSLAITLYLASERVAERSRVALASEEEIAGAIASLREVRQSLLEVALASEREISLQERRERAPSETVRDAARAALADARRVRSLSRYYAGWAGYYTALLDADRSLVSDSIRDFGYLLDSMDERPTFERLPKRLLQYEHVSRAAVGVALCLSLDDRHAEARRWIEELSEAPEFALDVIDQLRSAAIVVLARATAWGELTDLVAQWRGEGGRAMSSGEARLLAVTALDALRDEPLAPSDRRHATSLARVALAGMAQAGSIEHVIDLAAKYDDLPIGDEGFIFQYAKGIRRYQAARDRHEGVGADATRPTEDGVARRDYTEAASLFARALAAPDAGRSPRQRDECRLNHGLSLYYSGEFAQAAFELAKLSESEFDRVRDEAVWMRVVALDTGVEKGLADLESDRNEAAQAYLRSYPRTNRAALLVLRLADAVGVSDEQAVEILASVPPDAPHYEATQRQRRRLLYRIFRRTPLDARDDAARAFFAVAGPLLRADEDALFRDNVGRAEELAQSLLLGVRQLLDVTLSSDGIDTRHAVRGVETLRRAEANGLLDLGLYREELLFRELQIAIRRDEADRVDQLLGELHDAGGVFSDAADRVMYREAIQAWAAPPRREDEARAVVRHGTRVIDVLERDDPELERATTAAVFDQVADVAAYLFQAEGDEAMRDLAIVLDERLLSKNVRSAASLRRVAELAESRGEAGRAVEAWLELMGGLREGELGWYEARYHSIRLMLLVDAGRAATVMGQFRVLHPGTIPPPWDQRFKDLEAQIRLAPGRGGG
jgi:hypothetical protein